MLAKGYQCAIGSVSVASRLIVRVVSIAGIVAASAMATGCDDTSVRIRFDIANGEYRRQVVEVTLRMLLPPEDPEVTFTCDALKYGQVSEDTLRASQLQEVIVRVDGDGRLADAPLSGVPRLGTKLFWIEAIDGKNEPIVAGCGDLGEVTGDATVTVAGEPTAVLAFTGETLTKFPVIGRPLDVNYQVLVTDTLGDPLKGIDLQWRVIGLAGTEWQKDIATTNDFGEAGIRVASPRMIPGPALLDVSGPWERTPLPDIGGFAVPQTIDVGQGLPVNGSDQNLAQVKSLYAVGQFGPQGEMGFVALGPTDDTTGEARQILVAYYTAANTFNSIVAGQTVSQARSIATIRTGGRDIPMLATGAQLIELDITATAITPVARGMPWSPGESPEQLVQAGPCQGDADLLLVTLASGDGNTRFQLIDSSGQEVNTGPFATAPGQPAFVAGSGCVSGLAGELTRTVAYGPQVDSADPETNQPFRQSIVADTGQRREGEWINFARVVGFTPQIAEHPASLLGVELDLDGTSLVRYRLAIPQEAGKLDLELYDEDDLFNFVRGIHGGDIDGDGRVDIVALMEFGTGDRRQQGSVQVRMQIVLGAEHQGKRIVGISTQESLLDPQLFVADFNRDGADDILLAHGVGFEIIPGVIPPK